MSTATQEQAAPPITAPKGGKDFVRFEPFPKNDSYILTILKYEYTASHPFERKDDKTGVVTVKNGPALELVFGAMVGNKAYFLKTWPAAYSMDKKAKFTAIYDAAIGRVPVPGDKADDLIGKQILGTVKVENKVSPKGTAYTVSKLASVSPVPSILAGTGADIKTLLPAFQAALAASGDQKKDSGNPY